jgi:hypothetical protein
MRDKARYTSDVAVDFAHHHHRRGTHQSQRIHPFRSDPAIHLGYLEFPPPANTMGRHALLCNPAVERFSGNPEMRTHLVG